MSQATPLILKDIESRPWIPTFQNAQMDLGKVSPDVAEGRPGPIQTRSSVLPFLHNPDVETEGPPMSQVPSLQEGAVWGKAGQGRPLEARWGCSEIIVACFPSTFLWLLSSQRRVLCKLSAHQTAERMAKELHLTGKGDPRCPRIVGCDCSLG